MTIKRKNLIFLLYCSRNETSFSYCETIVLQDGRTFAAEIKKTAKPMVIELIHTVALAATLIVVLLVMLTIIIYQRWRIGDQNIFIERFIRQNEELRRKLRKAGILP